MEIQYPIKKSEFDIQAELYSKLKSAGYDVFGEVKYLDKTQPKGYRECRFDIVVFKKKKAVCIIEVKTNKPDGECKYTRQFRKYRNFGIPLIYCFGEEEIDRTMTELFCVMPRD